MVKRKINFRELAKECALLAEEKKAKDIVVLDIRRLSFITDYFVIATANSYIHLDTLSDWIISNFKKNLIYPLHKEGKGTAQWILIDYGGVIVHIFLKEARDFYQLEKLWVEAKRINFKKIYRKKPKGK